MTVSSASVDQSEAGRAFLQHRMAKYGLFGASIGFVFFAIRTGDWLAHLEISPRITHPSRVYHFLAALSMLSMWRLCRWGVLWHRASPYCPVTTADPGPPGRMTG